jgi:hypothetical protein
MGNEMKATTRIGAIRPRRGRPRNLDLDPLRLKVALAEYDITLGEIAERLGGSTPARRTYVCNVLAGRQCSRPVVELIQALITEKSQGKASGTDG